MDKYDKLDAAAKKLEQRIRTTKGAEREKAKRALGIVMARKNKLKKSRGM